MTNAPAYLVGRLLSQVPQAALDADMYSIVVHVGELRALSAALTDEHAVRKEPMPLVIMDAKIQGMTERFERVCRDGLWDMMHGISAARRDAINALSGEPMP